MSKEDTTLIWLQNKLGSTTHLWSFSSTVVSQYTVDKLKVIRDNFVTLDSLVKLKFFLSLFYIPRRNMEEVIWHFLLDACLIFLDDFYLNSVPFGGPRDHREHYTNMFGSVDTLCGAVRSILLAKFVVAHRRRLRLGALSRRICRSKNET